MEWLDMVESRLEGVIWMRVRTQHTWINIGGCYLPPAGSAYLDAWTVEPLAFVTTRLRLLAEAGLPTVLLGDMNARVGCLVNPRINPRGRSLLDLAQEAPWRIYPPPACTFHSTQGSSAIDHVLFANAHVVESIIADPLVSHHSYQDIAVLLFEKVLHRPLQQLPDTCIPDALTQNARPLPLETQVDRLEKRLVSVLRNAAPAEAAVPPPARPSALLPIDHPSRRAMHRLALAARSGQLSEEEMRAFATAAKQGRRDQKRDRRCRKRLYCESVLTIRSAKQYWRHVMKIVNTKKDQSHKADPTATAEHFRSLLQHAPPALNLPPARPLAQHRDLMTSPFTRDEVLAALAQPNDSAPGEDGLTRA